MDPNRVLHPSNFVVDQSTDCWIWSLRKHRFGYAVASINGEKHLVHRWIMGEPKDLYVMHLCHGGANGCVNPKHLRIGTAAENNQAMWAAGRGRARCSKITHCPRGHEYTPENTYIYPKGNRACIICMRQHTRDWRKRKRLKEAK